MKTSEVTLDMLLQQLKGEREEVISAAKSNFNTSKAREFRLNYRNINYETPLQCAFNWHDFDGGFWRRINDETKYAEIKVRKMFTP